MTRLTDKWATRDLLGSFFWRLDQENSQTERQENALLQTLTRKIM